MVSFWKDKSKKQLDPELFSSMADKLAEEVFNEGSNKTNKPTQIRKFYDEVLRFDSILKSIPPEKQKEEFINLLPYLKMLNAKAAYAMGRELISKKFKDFISNSMKQINDKDDFDAFSGLFEAFMGYYKFYRPSEGGRK